MKKSIVFHYKIYKNFPSPIIKLALYGRKGWSETEAYVDSGASISLFSPIEAERIGIEYAKGRKTFSMVGDGSLIPVYLHNIPTKIGDVTFKAVIGFSSHLGVGFNLLGRKNIFTAFDVLFSDAAKTITFIPRSI